MGLLERRKPQPFFHSTPQPTWIFEEYRREPQPAWRVRHSRFWRALRWLLETAQ